MAARAERKKACAAFVSRVWLSMASIRFLEPALAQLIAHDGKQLRLPVPPVDLLRSSTLTDFGVQRDDHHRSAPYELGGFVGEKL